MSTWPATLPQQPIIDGYQRTQQKQVARTDMDSGPAYQRRRFTAASTFFQTSFILTDTQRQTFWDFFNNTIGGGAAEFTFYDPVTDAAGIYRFMGDEVPSETAYSRELFKISAKMEKLP